MDALAREFLEQKRFAVVGSFRDESRFAYRIMKQLEALGREVFPVNPRLADVGGRACYGSVRDIEPKVDVVNIVTPPTVTAVVLRDCLEKEITRAWLQPGAESPAAIAFCRENGIRVVYGICVMLSPAGKPGK